VKLLLAVLSLWLAQSLSAATLSSNGSSSDVNAKIGQASAGDTVTIPSGTFSDWNVTLNKGVTLQGAGASSIVKGKATSAILSLTNTSGLARVTGLKFDGGTTQSVMIIARNGGKALIDHCELSAGSASEMIHNEAYGPDPRPGPGWSNNVVPGSDDALYVEDCTFSKNPFQDQYFWGTSAVQNYYGSRTVFRHNQCNYCQIDVHGTQGMVGGRWFEIYANTFTLPSGGGNQSDFIVLRGGSGVVYGNTVTGGPNGGAGNINLYDENGGSSPAYLGKGWSQNFSPVYLWATDPKMHVGGGSNVQSGRDYFASSTQPASMKVWQQSSQNANSTYAYVALAYPHPGQGGGGGGTPTPTPAPTPTPTPTPPSTKFSIGDWIKNSPNAANVRATPAGNLVGTQPVNTAGVIVAGPTWGQLADAASGVFWWKIDFTSGADGWVGEDNLVAGQAPSPSPTPSPTATPSPTPGSPTYEHWIQQQNDWIRAHPPQPDAAD
jgi:hypothetical protein